MEEEEESEPRKYQNLCLIEVVVACVDRNDVKVWIVDPSFREK